MQEVRNLLAFIRSYLNRYGYHSLDAAELLGPVTIKAKENHGEEWDQPRWFYTAISNVLQEERYRRHRGREGNSVRAVAYLSDTLPGDDGYSEYGDIFPSSLPEPEESFFLSERWDELLRLAEIDSRVALRLYEELGYTHEELEELTGLTRHQIRLKSSSTLIDSSGIQTVCVSCRKPKAVNEEYLCKDCRVDQEFTELPKPRNSPYRRGGNFSKRPWLNRK